MFKRWFEDEQRLTVRQGVLDHTVRHLSASKARFASYITPLSRLILHIDALVRTALRILASREAKDNGVPEATSFLRLLSSEGYLQLAMMADAAEETSTLLRACDADQLDTAQLNLHVSEFQRRVSHMFVDGACIRVEETFTGFALSALSTVRTWKVGSDKYSFGGAPPDMVQRCLARMQRWHRLALDVVRTEFPSFEVVASFRVFDLGNGLEESAGRDRDPELGAEACQALQRLASVFTLDYVSLRSSYVAVVGLARRLKSMHNLTNLASWRQAVDMSRKSHAVGPLVSVLQRCAAFDIATSMLEWKFPLDKWLVRPHAAAEGEDTN